MFQNILTTVRVNISTVRSIIKTNERLRQISFGANTLIQKESYEETELILDTLMQDIPRAREWRVYDHCAAVTRLYAIYERFVEDLVSDWLVLLPRLFPRYLTLEEKIRNTHQTGVGRLLLELKKNRYEHLSIEEVIRGLFHGTTGEAEYELLPDAFLLHEQNLRKETLVKLLADAGIADAWNWVEKHRDIQYFVQEIRASENTAEGELNELISYRNEAAHGAPIDNFLGSNALLELCDFIETLCQALAELVTYQVIERKKSIGDAREIGRITEWFKGPKAGVAKVEKTTLSVGGSLFLVNEARSCCQLAKIESIRMIEDAKEVDKEQVEIISESEVGLKFDVDARKELRLYQLKA
ncbi:MAG: hypothetical protein KME32_09910 [Mojavia pulchra JT2-VF2]|jgi:hypothetical protein|uniref:RiboL-PSP-HEPN domain-containing protein n=1 Tax=Mojavia pulchra JT2-VF2 TaxID=287848 RepID=A0A951UFT2_9NOST|nr:hypothetical protein [Mojavia pulchra JT2-VF2]